MFKLGAGEAVGEQLVERVAADEIPIFQPHDLHVGDAVAAQLAQAQIDALDRRPAILEMAVDHDKPRARRR